jgi:hypothetical protein
MEENLRPNRCRAPLSEGFKLSRMLNVHADLRSRGTARQRIYSRIDLAAVGEAMSLGAGEVGMEEGFQECSFILLRSYCLQLGNASLLR